MARKPCTWRKIFLWQEDPAPGGRFFCGKRVQRRAEDFFVARESRAGRKIFFVARSLCAGREIFLWQESPEPGAGFDKTYNFFNFFFSVPPFSLLSLPFPFLRSPFLSSPFSALSFSPSCFPSFLFSFSSPFFLSSSLSLVISLNSFSFYFCIVALPSCRFSFLLSLGSDERQKTETTGSKKTETTERKKRSDGRQKRKRRTEKKKRRAERNESDRRQKTEETGRKR